MANTKYTLIKDIPQKVGEEITIAGWVDVRRDHGKLMFIDLRDATGKVQMVALPNHAEAKQTLDPVRSEWVIEVVGKVNPRPPKLVNAEEPNGAVEIEILSVVILNSAETPAFDIHGDGMDIGEEVRLKRRYLDLRRARLQRNIRTRHEVMQFVRNFLSMERFVEIETPILGKSTPEGSRDYLVPSRLDQGKFYALPQSPQQYKQLLMASGFERYFQVARCMRDEDSRGDRQPEFTQLDMEMSFVEREDVMDLNERLLIALVKAIAPEKRIQQVPFPRLTYAEAMAKYQSDKPDIRENKNDPNLLAFCWVVDFPFFEKTEADGEGKPGWTFTHNPFSAPKPEFMGDLMSVDVPKRMEKNESAKIEKILTTQYDIALNGFEIGGGSIRNHRPESLTQVLKIMGHSEEKINANFGHMLEAFKSGTPPHGGIAWGLDRLMAILMNEPNIREVIAFPKNGEGRDLMQDAPSAVDVEKLVELGIKVMGGEGKK